MTGSGDECFARGLDAGIHVDVMVVVGKFSANGPRAPEPAQPWAEAGAAGEWVGGEWWRFVPSASATRQRDHASYRLRSAAGQIRRPRREPHSIEEDFG